MTAAATATGEIPAEDAPSPGALYSFGTPWPEFNEGISYTDTFRCADAGATTTLVEFYSNSYKSSAPLPGWIKRIRDGQITVDGEVATDPDMILREGSKLVYHRLPWQEPFAPHLLDVLYEDDDMIALNKPSGLQVLPKGLFQQRTVLAQLQLQNWKMPSSLCSKQKDVQSHPVPVHRLGRGTSGLLLCAKTKLAKAQLAAYFAEGATNAGKSRDEIDICKSRKISKFYRALVTGILENDEVMITQPIGLVRYPGVAEGLYAACSSGKPAMSKVCVLERLEHHNQTLVQVEIHSGRPHQIRIHLAYIGHPLVDDPLYGIGGQAKFDEPEPTCTADSFAYDGGYERPLQPVPGDCGYHLHAHWLVLCHPTTNELQVSNPLPAKTSHESNTKRSERKEHEILSSPLPWVVGPRRQTPMEGSPATRLPEADSLPDGFVESSAADQAPPPADAGDPASRSLGLDQADATVGSGGGDETLGAPPSTLASVAQETLDAYSAADALQSLTMGSAAEPERALGEPAGDAGDAKESSKESSVVEQVESMADQKGSGEQKRKVVKKSKVEKDRELFELAQAYHKVVAERDAAIAVKEKLESLCREFQRQNKVLKEECRRVSSEGQNMRMELSDKFNNAIKDVSVKLDEQKNESIAQLEENNLVRSKLKDLADQYNITQQKYAHQLKEKMLELELADLKMQQHQEKTAQEQTQMQLYADQVSQLMATEKNLRLQLAADGERFQQFQDALTKSNEVFETYKKEMEKMVKLIKDLKKENEFLKSKCENSDVALVKLIEERELMKKQVDKFKNQKEKLESLCRSLQAERKQSPSGGTPDATSNETNLATIES